MQISWKDVKVVNETLTSIENAYKYSTVPTEFILILNGQTKNYMDTPINDPEEQWIHFMSHPFVKHCEIVHITDKDPIFGPPCEPVLYGYKPSPVGTYPMLLQVE